MCKALARAASLSCRGVEEINGWKLGLHQVGVTVSMLRGSRLKGRKRLCRGEQ